jgi:FkbM family methyltransferase
MKQGTWKSILSFFPPSIRARVKESFNLYGRFSFSQHAEDLIAESYLTDVTAGFYVDIGAHHPVRLSNTYRFYRKGWKGINVDPNPVAIDKFRARRPHDINIEAGIAAIPGTMTFYMFDSPEVNTLSETMALKQEADGYKLMEKRSVEVLTLASLLDRHIARNQEIDLLSIDVEGLEMEVLESNDWNKYCPRLILVELNDADVRGAVESSTAHFLLSRDYQFIAKSYNTLAFIRPKR